MYQYGFPTSEHGDSGSPGHFSICAATGSAHIVQFYDDEHFLAEVVADFLAPGLAEGQSAIVIATEAHRRAFIAGLSSRGVDVDAACGTGQFTLLDARETLSGFMVGSRPDAKLFAATIGGLVEKKSRMAPHAPLLAYGEMVDLLWRDGEADAAIRLEELWNCLASTQSFSLLCAYAMGNFANEGHTHHFEEICRTHGHVVPAEGYPQRGSEASRLREIARLQQRARALEAEIERRTGLEQSLRDALAERIRAQQERERLLGLEQAARAEAENANRLKDEFLAVLSHELRTPLNAILGWTQIVNGRRTDEETTRRALEVIGRNASLQLHLIEDLLDVSRIVCGKLQIGADPVDLVAVAGAAIDSVRPSAAAKDIELDVQVDESAQLVTGDATRLHQVIWNLLSNAVKFTPKQGRVELRLERAGSDAQMVVKDNGLGIPSEFVPRVFDRFRQADTSTTRQHGGLGLGLAVVRYLVEAHGGTVAAASEGPGLGATFTVRLPLRAASADVVAGRPLRGQPVV